MRTAWTYIEKMSLIDQVQADLDIGLQTMRSEDQSPRIHLTQAERAAGMYLTGAVQQEDGGNEIEDLACQCWRLFPRTQISRRLGT